jgi:AsmA protein
MQQPERRERPTAVFFLVACCLVVGLAGPLVLSLTGTDLSLRGAAVVAAPRDTFSVTDPVILGDASGVTLERGTILLTGPAANSDSTAAALATGTSKLTVDGGVFRVESKRLGANDALRTASYDAPLADALSTLKFETLSVRRSSVTIALPDGHAETIDDVEAEVSQKRTGTIGIKGKGTLRGQPAEFETVVSTVQDRRAGQRPPLKLTIKGPLFQVAFDGRVDFDGTLAISGQTELSIASLRLAARSFGALWPNGAGLRDIKIKGHLDWTGAALAFDKATFQMDGNEATGTLTVGLRSGRPTLTGTLALKSLNLSPYFSEDGRASSTPLSWASFASTYLAMPLSQHFDADVRISAARLLAGGIEFGRSAAAVSLRSGRLLADIVEFDMNNGGPGSGQITVDFTGPRPRLGLRGKLEGFDPSRVTTAAIGYSALQGSATITADVSANGHTVPDLVSTLSGKIAVSLKDGGQVGFDMRALLDAAQKKEVEGWGTGAPGQTPIDQFDARLSIYGGVMWCEQAQILTADSILTATGTANLLSNRLDLRVVRASAPLSQKASDAKGEALIIRGPWSRPSIMTEGGAGKSAVPADGPGEQLILPSAQSRNRG